MAQFEYGSGDWTAYRSLSENYTEVDLHSSDYRQDRDRYGPPDPYCSKMANVYDTVLAALKKAQEDGLEYVIFTHGWSTSRPGQTTARSVVRGLMRSKESTQYIIKSRSIQHQSVFVAAIRPKRDHKKS